MKTKTQKTTRTSLLEEIAQKTKGAKPTVRSFFLHEIKNYRKAKLQRIAKNVKVLRVVQISVQVCDKLSIRISIKCEESALNHYATIKRIEVNL